MSVKQVLVKVANEYSRFISNVSYIVVKEFSDTILFMPCIVLITLSLLFTLSLALEGVPFALLIVVFIMITYDIINNITSIMNSLSSFTKTLLNMVFISSYSVCLIGLTLYMLSKYTGAHTVVAILPLLTLSLTIVYDDVKSNIISRIKRLRPHITLIVIPKNVFYMVLIIGLLFEVFTPFAIPTALLAYSIFLSLSILYILFKSR